MISIQDTTGTLSAADLAALRTHQAGLSYRILVTAAGSRAELDAAAGRLVTSSDGIGIALDPVHHQVYTHFGVGTGISLMEREVIRETPRYEPPSSSYDSDSSSSFDSGDSFDSGGGGGGFDSGGGGCDGGGGGGDF